jgi:hypothetical protein
VTENTLEEAQKLMLEYLEKEGYHELDATSEKLDTLLAARRN